MAARAAANFAEAIAERRQGASERSARDADYDPTRAFETDGQSPAADLQRGDVVIVEAGDVIPADGEIIEGVGSVDESAITGESAPVIRESGGDRSAVTGGTKLLSDRLVIEVTQEPGKSFLDRMIALVEGAERRKTPNEIALNILLAGLTITFVAAVVTLRPFALYAGTSTSTTVLIALLVALIPTTIGALLSAIGIAGIDRLVQRNVLAMSGRAVEASGDVDVLLLDKTGTITLGNRQAAEFLPVAGVEERELAEVAQLASLADETPEGRSIVVLAKERFGLRERDLGEREFIPFSATTRMSGVDMNGTLIRKGAADAVERFIGRAAARRATSPGSFAGVAEQGGTPLLVARDNWALGVIHLKDCLQGLAEGVPVACAVFMWPCARSSASERPIVTSPAATSIAAIHASRRTRFRSMGDSSIHSRNPPRRERPVEPNGSRWNLRLKGQQARLAVLVGESEQRALGVPGERP